MIRVAWLIEGYQGRGDWFPEDDKHLRLLFEHIAVMVDKYGEGSHWLEHDKEREHER